jgi:predicted  nucleic acid-binding Zn-ribbon protein
MMYEPSKELGYENELRTLQKQIEDWNKRIIELENVGDSNMTVRGIVAALEARVKEVRKQIQSLPR